MNKKSIESLIKCGALDSTDATRKGMLAVLGQARVSEQKSQEDALSGQGSIFDLGDAAGGGCAAPAAAAHYPPIPTEEYERVELSRSRRRRSASIARTHPLADVRHLLRARTECSLAERGGKDPTAPG